MISRVANFVMSWTLRPVETRPQGPRAAVRFLGGTANPSPHQLGDLGSAVSSPAGSWAEPRKIWILVHFGTLKITSERSASFRIWGEGNKWIWGRGKCPLPPQRRTAPGGLGLGLEEFSLGLVLQFHRRKLIHITMEILGLNSPQKRRLRGDLTEVFQDIVWQGPDKYQFFTSSACSQSPQGTVWSCLSCNCLSCSQLDKHTIISSVSGWSMHGTNCPAILLFQLPSACLRTNWMIVGTM